jgi:hypothetical protein
LSVAVTGVLVSAFPAASVKTAWTWRLPSSGRVRAAFQVYWAVLTPPVTAAVFTGQLTDAVGDPTGWTSPVGTSAKEPVVPVRYWKRALAAPGGAVAARVNVVAVCALSAGLLTPAAPIPKV